MQYRCEYTSNETNILQWAVGWIAHTMLSQQTGTRLAFRYAFGFNHPTHTFDPRYNEKHTNRI